MRSETAGKSDSCSRIGYSSVSWVGGIQGYLRLLDQTRLPNEVTYLDCRQVAFVFDAIRSLSVRGAPAIGIAAAYGVLLAYNPSGTLHECLDGFCRAEQLLRTSRPTAVNLFWALDRMKEVMGREYRTAEELASRLLVEASSIYEEDRQMCRSIGVIGADLIADGATVITHCNAGGLATSEYGTALSIVYTCQDQGKSIQVVADETRPLWQGSRLTAWELQMRGIPVTLISDSMAAYVMQCRRVDAVIVGADRITSRGDVANKIGTFGLAVAAHYHGIPFYVAAPSSTFDLSLVKGAEIPIEERSGLEITQSLGVALAPEGVSAFNPAFDVTPAELITAIITERGLISPVNESEVQRVILRK